MPRDVRTSPKTSRVHRRDAEAEDVHAVQFGMKALDDTRIQVVLQPSEADRRTLQEVRAVRQAGDDDLRDDRLR